MPAYQKNLYLSNRPKIYYQKVCILTIPNNIVGGEFLVEYLGVDYISEMRIMIIMEIIVGDFAYIGKL